MESPLIEITLRGRWNITGWGWTTWTAEDLWDPASLSPHCRTPLGALTALRRWNRTHATT